jgi:hypothetical protein
MYDLNLAATNFANTISSNNTNDTVVTPTNTYINQLSNATTTFNTAVTANNSISSVNVALTEYISTINQANITYNNTIVAIGSIDDPTIASAITAYNAANAAAITAYNAANDAITTAATAYVAAATTAYNATAAAETTAYNAAAAANPDSSNLILVPAYIHDVTQTLELLMDVRIMNLKLGIVKDASNILILNSLSDYYDSSTFTFLQNSITITPDDIITAINRGQLISTGALSICYTQFSNYVKSYYKFDDNNHGISTIFDSNIKNIPHEELNAYELSQLFITGNIPNGNGAYIYDLSGQLYIPNVSQTLRPIVTDNIFNNRVLYSSVIEGFMEGDIICSPSNGTTINFSIAMDQKAFAFPEIKTDTIDTVSSQQIDVFTQQNPVPGTCLLTNTYNKNQISQSYSIGITIRLANLS